MERNSKQHILVNDPSMTAWGYVVINQGGKIVDRGCIKTEPDPKKSRIRKGDSTIRRISEIDAVLLRVIREFNVVFIISELPHGSQNASAAVMIGVVAGLMQAISDTLEIGIEWYSEADAKKSLLGKRSATKKETIDKIKPLYNVPWFGVKYKDEAIADAMSIYHVAMQQSSTLKFLINSKYS